MSGCLPTQQHDAMPGVDHIMLWVKKNTREGPPSGPQISGLMVRQLAPEPMSENSRLEPVTSRVVQVVPFLV